MSKSFRVIVEAAASVLVAAGMEFSINKVADQASWKWIAVLGAFIVSAVAALAVERSKARQLDHPETRVLPRSPRLTAHQFVLCFAIVVLLAGFVVVWTVPRGRAEAADSANACRSVDQPPYEELPFLCDIPWRQPSDELRVRKSPSEAAEGVDDLRASQAPQYFACYLPGETIAWDGKTDHYWLLTQGDEHGAYGYVPVVYLARAYRGAGKEPLSQCDVRQRDLAKE
ncbi:hypothetical protein [Paractinoplanes toevensis]|uniref:Uncharacterized protein n=1 Tax=Paractinoplanes toevensis TaxID=571911 RepID=A0A919W3Y2_9ACTN|nr:hypothetical protein [Actinoplanes toevensis]GIM95327.1 hypothetical protein Ato02nite_071200 [Actinoplanes toevensis]